MVRIFSLIGLVAFLLVACLPFAPQPAPTQEPDGSAIQTQIGTSVALTLTSIFETQVAGYTPTAEDTPTPVPTATLTPLPTFTPFPTSTPYRPPTVIPTTPAPYACQVLKKTPADNTVFKKNADFDIKFWLKNVGTKRWDAGIDLLYDSGTNLLKNPNFRYELPEVKPGETVGPFLFDARAPKKAGTYVMVLKLQGRFCLPYIRIIVQ